MAGASAYNPSFNSGEFSPRMDARVDFEKYGAGISRGLNLVCLPQGGITNRPGTRFIKEVKSSSDLTAMYPFLPTTAKAYNNEFGPNYVRFYRNQGQLSVATTASSISSGAWTNRSTGSASAAVSGTTVTLTGAANGYAQMENALTVAAGDQATIHVVQFTVTGDASSTINVQIGSSSGAADKGLATGLGIGYHTIGFTPGIGTVYFQLINPTKNVMVVSSIRVMSNEPLQIQSDYSAADAQSLRTAQSGDVQYLFNDNHRPYKLQRRGDLSWSLVKVFFSDGPWLEINPGTDLAATNLMLNGRFDSGLANWTQAVTGNGYVNYDATSRAVILPISKDGASTARISQPVTTGASAAVHVIHFQIVGGGQVTVSIGTTDGGTEILAIGALNAGWYSYSFTPGVSTFYVAFATNNSLANIAGGVAGVFCYNTSANLIQPSALSGSITVTSLGNFKPFASTDVGRSIRFEYLGREPGWGIITAFSTSSSVTVQLYRNVPSITPVESWRLGAWSDTTGWPHVCTFHQQRLFAARNALRSQTMWASQSSDFENMRPDAWVVGASSVLDTSALNFTLASLVPSPITWMTGARRLVVGTGAGQYAITSKGAAVTPSDFSADLQTSVKCLDAPALQIDTAGLFIERAKRQIYDLGYSFQIDSFKASDVTIISDHIGKGNFAQIAYQAQPFSVVWCRLEDGTLAAMTYKRDQNVVGWTPIEIAGSVAGDAVVEWISVIPGDSDAGQTYSSINRDEVWLIVRRTINGLTKRYIEVMEGYFDGPNRAQYLDKQDWRAAVKTAQADAFYVDAGLTYKGAPATVISGLSHLEGETVKVVADGAQQADKIVTSGAITLDLAASTVQVGLGYSWEYRGLKLPYGSPTGSSVGQVKNINGIVFVLRDAASFDYAIDLTGSGDEDIDTPELKPAAFRIPSDPMSTAVPLFSGEFEVDSTGGFNSDPRIIAQGSTPLPWTLLGIAPRIDETQL